MTIQSIIRVILADDHPLIRRGIRRILEKTENVCVVGEASTGRETIQLVQRLMPDVLILDLEMPDIKGIQVARELRANRVPVSIVVLSASDDSHFIREVLQVGVDGYVHKSEPAEKIREVVHQVSRKYAFALTLLLMGSLPKIGLVFHHTISSLSLDINLL